MENTALLDLIEPTIEQAYQDHMTFSGGKQREPIDPLELLGRVSDTDSRDILEFGPVLRERYQAFAGDFAERYGVDLQAVTAAAYLVNLLTEDNLPHYTATLNGLAGRSEAWKTWNNEWTAEEDSHGVLMRDLALCTGLIRPGGVIDTAVYQAGRTSQLRTGTEIAPASTHHAFSYLTLQEHLTKEAHNKLSWLVDSTSRRALRPISGDEQNHYEFYRKLSEGVLDFDPDGSLRAMAEVYKGFDMPGKKGIPGFNKHAMIIGLSGLFDLESIVRSQRLIADKLDVEGAEPITDKGKHAQAAILQIVSDESIASNRTLMESLRESAMANREPGTLLPFILGRTIDFSYAGSGDLRRPTGLVPIAT